VPAWQAQKPQVQAPVLGEEERDKFTFMNLLRLILEFSPGSWGALKHLTLYFFLVFLLILLDNKVPLCVCLSLCVCVCVCVCVCGAGDQTRGLKLARQVFQPLSNTSIPEMLNLMENLGRKRMRQESESEHYI
jgi:hypothetical protein